MNFDFTEEQSMLRKTARNFLENECPESYVRAMQEDEKGYSPDLWKKMADLGWLGIPVPEHLGGTEGSFLDMVVLFEEIGRAMLPSPILSTVLAELILLDMGNEHQQSELLPKLASGDLIVSLALTEQSATWEARGINCVASESKSNFLINGTKLFVHDAHLADYLICAARTKTASEPDEGITLLLIDTGSKGLDRTVLKTSSHDKQCEVVFNNVEVPKENILGDLNKGWGQITRALQAGAVILCAQMIGAGERILEMVVDYAKTRVQFDQLIGVNQYIHQHCIDIFSRVEASRWVTYQAAYKLEQGLPAELEVAIAKAWTSDAHAQVCLSAHQVLSGIGYSEESTLPLFTKRGKMLELYLGDSSFHRKKVAGFLKEWYPEMPRKEPLGIWDEIESVVWP